MQNLFFIRFLISSLVLSVLTFIIMVVKKVFQKHIALQWQYKIWMIFIFMLFIPLIPEQLFRLENLENFRLNHSYLNENTIASMSLLSNGSKDLLQSQVALQDFALSVNNSTMNYLNLICAGIWFLGAAACTTMIFICNHGIEKIKCTIRPIENEIIKDLFEKRKSDLKITRNLMLGESNLIQTPMIFGLRKVYIILPTKSMEQLGIEDINYILLHELTHYKNKDILINYVICFFQIIYWFNPLIYCAFKKMRADREVACDIGVLKSLEEDKYIEYGRTIINFAEILSRPVPFATMTSMGGTKKQITNRIEKIACFKTETKLTKVKSFFIYLIISAFILAQAPAISIMAYANDQYNFKEKKVVYEDLSPYFKGMDGSFVLYDLQTEQYSIYNKDISMTRFSPNSTYKIYSALIALETGVLEKDNLIRKWNGVKQPYQAWNQDQNLATAMKYSVNWYFQELDRGVGQEKLQYYFDQMGYGNSNLSGGISRYWMESSLRISPVEQVELLKDFYTKNMIFQPEHINLVKETLKISEKNGAVLSGKTGTGLVNGKSISGWFVGYVEKQGHTFIFATNIQEDDHVSGSLSAEITLSILKDKNIY